jgi:hypothetical protein
VASISLAALGDLSCGHQESLEGLRQGMMFQLSCLEKKINNFSHDHKGLGVGPFIIE